MLSLVAILPRQVDDQFMLLLVLTSLEGCDQVIPAACGRLPLGSFHANRGRRLRGMGAILACSFRVRSRGGGGRPATFLSRQGSLRVLEYLLSPANAVEVFVQCDPGVFPI